MGKTALASFRPFPAPSGARRAALTLLFLAACAEPGSERTITETRVAAVQPFPAVPGASSAMRFRIGGEAPSPERARPPLTWRGPDGWRELAPTDLRVANFLVGGDPRAECYVTLLPGESGGLAPNVNRWRSQMGQPPLDDDAIAALSQRLILGALATVVEIDGTFTGMGSESLADARMVGAILVFPTGSLFVKMIGPRDVIVAERPRFEEFCDSLRVELPDEPDVPVAAEQETQGLEWLAPSSWNEDPPRPMRIASFNLGPEGRTECYVTVLGGSAGGTAANVDRWRQQLGLAPLSANELDALPRITVLERDSVLFEGYGSFEGMGADAQADAGMLGVVCELGGETVFVKMIGPADVVRGERERFTAFCTSLRMSE